MPVEANGYFFPDYASVLVILGSGGDRGNDNVNKLAKGFYSVREARTILSALVIYELQNKSD
jgi:hypothetical protein